MATVSEFAAIDVLRRALTRGSTDPSVRVGIGDDAAVLRCPPGELVCSVDASLEGVHFDLRWLSVELAARRAVHAAVSDLAAMAAAPLAAVVSLEVPRGTSKRCFAAIAKGQARAANETSCPIVGGNITRGERLAFTTTVLGTNSRGGSVLRSGARPGDEVWLSDEVGWAGLGLSMLQSGQVTFNGRGYRSNFPTVGRVAAEAARRWSIPWAKVATAREWRMAANCMIDVSDSLASEARHIAEASGVRVVLDADKLTANHAQLLRASRALERDPLKLLLYGGEDYALLATGAAKVRPAGAKVIGSVEQGEGTCLHRDGATIALTGGFDHLEA